MMKAIMIMFDSLNRHMLPTYGCDWVKAPNFERLAKKAVTFDNCYAGSMPCMPARRELHTGRYNFLHRSWGPLEPFDDSMPELLQKQGIYTHLVSDHYHYWEDGGATYHQRYNTWECVRGQEGDKWRAEVKKMELPEHYGNMVEQDMINRKYTTDETYPIMNTFKNGIEFMETNYKEDNWFLQIETFDPHEPYDVPDRFKEMYRHNYDGPQFDWPDYSEVEEEGRGYIEHIRSLNAAMIAMCDENLGKVLDMMDEKNMWDDTMLIVNTDHGFLLGEHDWWGKVKMPFYQEVINTPFFLHDPRNTHKSGARSEALVSTIDIAPTLLNYFRAEVPKDMQGIDIAKSSGADEKVRGGVLFGMHGGFVNCTDGRYVYMRGPKSKSNQPLYEYTLMPTHMRSLFSAEELQTSELAQPFTFTKGCPVLKVKARGWDLSVNRKFNTALYDLEQDPKQENPIQNAEVENRMIELMTRLMKESDAPSEQYERLGLD